MEQRDQHAWELIYTQYTRLVKSWVHRHSSFADTGESARHFVNLAFQKLWRAIDGNRFAKFPTLKSLLRYLQICIHSAIIDHLRKHKAVQIHEGTDIEGISQISANPGIEKHLIDRQHQIAIWKCVESALKSDEERLVAYAVFQLFLKPREIAERYKNKFKTVEDVYRVKANLCNRLRRNRELRGLLEINA